MKFPTATPLSLAFLAGICLINSALAAVTTTDAFGSGGNAFTMDFVTIGNPGNTADTTGTPNPAGSVAYTYRMGSYEVSENMINKANSAGSLGITKDTRGVNKVATSVSWNEAARFVNYLNVSSGYLPAYKFSTRPGEIGYDANASITLWESGDVGYDMTNPFRNSNAQYFLPSDNEWYKAAYFSSSGTYYNYATGSDSIPTKVTSGTIGGTAVYGNSFATGPADITNAGGLSPYGTMGQGGNAFEWMETQIFGVNDSPGALRGMRGGSWFDSESLMSASLRHLVLPTGDFTNVGFRVASVPEPSFLFLTMLASVVLFVRRKR